jgi:5'-methylthioadenosine phosphorylase
MKIGIIGGSGLDNPELLEDYKEIEVDTPFGKPSSPLTVGKIKGIDIVILSRHGKKHEIPPTQINNKANIYALKEQGCKKIIATTAVGSLREEIRRGDFVIINQFIDFTRQRKVSFFEKFEFGAMHTPMAQPFSENLRKKIIESCDELKFSFHEKGTVITIEGPRFSTVAESRMFRQWGADVINMSIAPEAILANEAELEYAAIAMSTDYDCWRTDEIPVSWEQVSEVFSKNADNVKKLIIKTIEKFSDEEKYKIIKSRIRTIPNFPKQGVMFRDITTLLKDREGMRQVMEIFYNRYKDREIDVVAGIESRGFIIGGILAEKLNAGFVPIRKKGKLPGEKESEEYMLEYGTDSIEIHRDAISPGEKVLIIDDLIATGGTAEAACKLVERLEGKIIEVAFIIDLPDLKGKEKLQKYPVFSIVEFEGE